LLRLQLNQIERIRALVQVSRTNGSRLHDAERQDRVAERHVAELGRLFEKDDFNAYPVEEGARIVGLVSKFDFLACFVFTLAYMIPRYDDLMNRTVAEIMTPEFIYVREENKLTRVLQLMVDHRIRSMPVIEGDQRLVGIISRDDVMRALQCCTSERA